MRPVVKNLETGVVPITAIVTAFQRIEQTLETLRRIQACQPRPNEILVHVDGNQAKCADAVRKDFPAIGILTSGEPVGPGGGRNKLIAAARNEIVASFDDDSYPIDPDYFERVQSLFEQFPEASILCATVFHQGETMAGPAKAHCWVADFIGCGCVYRRRDFLTTSGYVPLPVAYGIEEVDLAIRLLANGRPILRTSWLRVFHDTRLQHHSQPKIVAASIANVALLAFLRYPVSLWPIGAAQCLNRVFWLMRRGRFAGVLSGLGMVLPHLWSQRSLRQPLSAQAVKSFLKLRRKPAPLNSTTPISAPVVSFSQAIASDES